MELTHERRLRIISKAWGRKQTGYCFFPWILGTAKDRDERIQNYHEGPAFFWPKDRAKILEHMAAHEDNDLYWCPSLFEKPRRILDLAMDECALWADLDKVDPNSLTEYPPTVAWETSPGRYQALWVISAGDIQGASWPGQENQRLTYYIDADPSGWDTTQLLRIPGWKNHKPEYRGQKVVGKLLWDNGRTYLPDEFTDLPDVPRVAEITDVLEDEVDRVDRMEVWGRVRLKVSKRVRELLAARQASGDRSDALWEIERELADAGCTVTEIVAICRASIWNKFAGRQDELRRLTVEASKAISLRPEQKKREIEQEWEERAKPQRLFELIKNVPAPRWLVKDLLTEGSCGFIAGQPKSFKSWFGLDLALSVATGAYFLDHFQVVQPGPVLYIQEEDSLATVKERVDKVWPSKQIPRVSKEDGEIWIEPPVKIGSDIPIDAYISEGVTISDAGWQVWLDETMEEGKYRLVLLDPLMMLAGEVEENSSQKMTEFIFKPLKQLSRKHDCAICIVHHMRKQSQQTNGVRGGQLMLGSVANHAWAEDSLYLKLSRGMVYVEHESKHSVSSNFKVSNIRNRKWDPLITREYDAEDPAGIREALSSRNGRNESSRNAGKKGTGSRINLKSPANRALQELGPGIHATKKIAEHMGITSDGARRQLLRLTAAGIVKRVPTGWTQS